MQKGITVDNAARLLHNSDDLQASRLRDICMRFVVRHFDTVSKSEVGSVSIAHRAWRYNTYFSLFLTVFFSFLFFIVV